MLTEITTGLAELWYLTLFKLPLFIIAIIVLLIFILSAKLLVIVIKQIFQKSGVSISQFAFLLYLARIAIYLLGFVAFLAILGVNLTALVTAVGLTGLVLGFALQDLVKNFVSGFLILSHKHFQIGDWIKIKGFAGKVKAINARSTTILTETGQEIIIPNKIILDEAIMRHPAHPQKRFYFDLEISATNSIKRAVEKGIEALLQTEGILQKPNPEVKILQISKEQIKLRFYFWSAKTGSENPYFNTRSIAYKNTKEKFDREGITF